MDEIEFRLIDKIKGLRWGLIRAATAPSGWEKTVNKKKENREIPKKVKFRISNLNWWEAGLGQEGRIQVQKYKAKKKNESYTKYLIK